MKSEMQFKTSSSWDYSVFDDSVRILRWRDLSQDKMPTDELRMREMWRHIRNCHSLHPVIDEIYRQHRPQDWQLLLFEWPHVSEKDPTRIAYSQNKRHLIDDRQTITNLGKYIRRHWPDMPDHLLRDYVASYTTDDLYIVRTMKEMIEVVEMGPRSCMQSAHGTIPFGDTDNSMLESWLKDKTNLEPDWFLHPYSVYDPKYGWAMCGHKNGKNEVVGRALLNINDSDKIYVRTYLAATDYSGSDHVMEQWLHSQGFKHYDSWPDGLKLAKLSHPDGEGTAEFMVPYLDGSDKSVEDCGGYLEIDAGGRWVCDNTDGTPTDQEANNPECDSCGENAPEDDMVEGYINGEHCDNICPYCRRNHFQWIDSEFTDRRDGHYSHTDNVAYTVTPYGTGEAYDDNFIPDDFVWVQNENSYAHVEDCVYLSSIDEYRLQDSETFIQIDGDWYLQDDDDIVLIDDEYYLKDDDDLVEIDGDYYLKDDDDIVQIDGDWYLKDDDDIVEIDGKYHLKDDCWECHGTGNWYPGIDEPILDEEGNTFHYTYVERISRAAEEGDTKLQKLRTAEAIT